MNLYLAILPGPTRYREPQLYLYRVAHRADPLAPGCVELWDVLGGRMVYQIALERGEDGTLAYSCTCADAVFVSGERGLACKHLEGLFAFHPAERSLTVDPRGEGEKP